MCPDPVSPAVTTVWKTTTGWMEREKDGDRATEINRRTTCESRERERGITQKERWTGRSSMREEK